MYKITVSLKNGCVIELNNIPEDNYQDRVFFIVSAIRSKQNEWLVIPSDNQTSEIRICDISHISYTTKT